MLLVNENGALHGCVVYIKKMTYRNEKLVVVSFKSTQIDIQREKEVGHVTVSTL